MREGKSTPSVEEGIELSHPSSLKAEKTQRLGMRNKTSKSRKVCSLSEMCVCAEWAPCQGWEVSGRATVWRWALNVPLSAVWRGKGMAYDPICFLKIGPDGGKCSERA